ncbi:MAG: proprotein convertase P-domain-containing protein [Thermoanaerobaculia bacterium]
MTVFQLSSIVSRSLGASNFVAPGVVLGGVTPESSHTRLEGARRLAAAVMMVLLPAALRAAPVTRNTAGDLVERRGLSLRLDDNGEPAVRRALARHSRDLLGVATLPELRLIDERESLRGRHYRYQQSIDDVPVVGAETTVAVNDRRIREVHARVARGSAKLQPGNARSAATQLLSLVPELATRPVIASDPVLLLQEGEARPAQRIVIERDIGRPIAYYVDAERAALLRVEPLYFNDAPARVFESNPVTRLNDPSLQDHDNTASAVPEAAYSTVTLRDLAASGRLSGPHVTIVDTEAPSPPSAEASQSLLFDRSQSGFEEVMAYHHLDTSQRYLQMLGYAGTRQIIRRPLPVDAHAANGADNSYYRSAGFGEGALFFGDGGVDDAEDPDILLHEYAHAIQDAIAPGAFNGSFASEARAISEGFSDYWAFSSGWAVSVIAGRDPFCIGDWDARCADSPSAGCVYGPGANCLRRVDGTKTIADYVRTDRSGVEHLNGEIWASALREIFVKIVASHGGAEGPIISDTLVLESHFGVPPLPAFRTLAHNMMEADRALYNGSHIEVICAAMAARGILDGGDCADVPRGEVAFYQGADRDRAIPDGHSSLIVSKEIFDTRNIEDVFVRVEIDHPLRADLRILLIGPDGTSRVLLDRSGDTGSGLYTTFGVDAQPVQSLDVFRGKPANGLWRLQVIDGATRDAGTLVSWGLVFRFAGDEPQTIRGAAAGPTLHVLAAGHTPGAAGTNFRTDLRILNRGTTRAEATAYFTNSGEDGSTKFAAIRIVAEPGMTIALDDAVDRDFRSSGVGAIELRGDVANLLVTSRTYNDTDAGTYGQFIPAVSRSEATAAGQAPLHIGQLQNTEAFRANIGFAEVAGKPGTVEITIYDAEGVVIEHGARGIEPFGHFQSAILGGRTGRFHDRARAEVRVIEGEARVAAYGSVVDNVSGDPIYVPASMSALPAPLDIPAVLHADGAAGTQWRTDLWLANPGATPVEVELRFHPVSGAPVRSDTVSMPAHSVRAFEDVVLARFGLSDDTGHIVVDAAAPLIATSRTWTTGESGSYGQFIGAVPAANAIAIGETATAIQLESSASYRTNAGVAETHGEPVTVRFTVRNAAGEALATADRAIPAGGHLQLSTRAIGAGSFTDGRVDIEVISGSGRVLGYASVIDNRTGDPIYIPAR